MWRVLCGGLVGLMLVSSTVLADGRPTTAPAATAVDAIKGYWQNVKAGNAEDALAAYFDTATLMEAIANKDPVLTAAQLAAAVVDMRRLMSAGWQNPQTQDLIKDSELSIKSEKPGDDGTTVVDYVVTIHRPQETQLDNTVYVRKSGDSWHIVDMRQGDAKMSEVFRSAWQGAHQAKPTMTLNEFVHEAADGAAKQNPPRSATTQK